MHFQRVSFTALGWITCHLTGKHKIDFPHSTKTNEQFGTSSRYLLAFLSSFNDQVIYTLTTTFLKLQLFDIAINPDFKHTSLVWLSNQVGSSCVKTNLKLRNVKCPLVKVRVTAKVSVMVMIRASSFSHIRDIFKKTMVLKVEIGVYGHGFNLCPFIFKLSMSHTVMEIMRSYSRHSRTQ